MKNPEPKLYKLFQYGTVCAVQIPATFWVT